MQKEPSQYPEVDRSPKPSNHILEINMTNRATSSARDRWVVWCDDKLPKVAFSRLQAKKLCANALDSAHFCKCNANSLPPGSDARITDLVVWWQGADGKFWRSLFVVSEIEKTEGCCPLGVILDKRSLRRYSCALSNERIWKLGSGVLVNPIKYYPVSFDEITTDSDAGMSCAGYRCIDQFPSIYAARAALAGKPSAEKFCATISDGVLKLWVEVDEQFDDKVTHHLGPEVADESARPLE